MNSARRFNDERAPFGSGFAREEAQRQALTKLFTECLEAL